jgi:hypothetical protein
VSTDSLSPATDQEWRRLCFAIVAAMEAHSGPLSDAQVQLLFEKLNDQYLRFKKVTPASVRTAPGAVINADEGNVNDCNFTL